MMAWSAKRPEDCRFRRARIQRIVTPPGVTLAAVRVSIAELVVFVPIVSPLMAPVLVPSVAFAASIPVGVVQVPLAIVQYSNLTDPTLLLLGTEKVKRWSTKPLGNDPPSMSVPTSAPSCVPPTKVSVRG